VCRSEGKAPVSLPTPPLLPSKPTHTKQGRSAATTPSQKYLARRHRRPSLRPIRSDQIGRPRRSTVRSDQFPRVAGLEPGRGMSCFAHRRWTDIARRQDGLLVFVFFISIPIRSSSNLGSSNSSSSASNLL
jgi:hypothetical protein